MPEGKDSDHRPISPLGQRFQDISSVFRILRPDFPETLKKLPNPAVAIQYLSNAYENYHEAGEHVYQNPKVGSNDWRAVAFLNNPRDTKEHWIALFEMLDASGFTDKDLIVVALNNYLAYMKIDGVRLEPSKRAEIRVRAHKALSDVYGD